jgi:hypothetical protein
MKIAEHGWRYGRYRRRFRRKFLGDAFDAVLGMLHGTNYPEGVREVLADRVIEFGRTTSERDPQRLAHAVLASLGIKF